MKKVLPYIFFFITLHLFAQKEANIWYFGQNAGIDFNTNPPTALTNGALNTLEGCSTFSDANGNILFYSDGITVWNKNHAIMNYSNGNPANNLKGNPSSTQSGMIIPKPGSATIFYLFTVGDNQNPAFDLYTIDMSLNGGLGELIDENNDGAFFVDLATPTGRKSSWTEKVAAVRGTDCNTFWVVSESGNSFFSYKIDINGVNTTPIVSIVNNSVSNSRGYLKLSPDGTKLAVAQQALSPGFIMYSFNASTGDVSNDGISLINGGDGQAYGVEFSIDSQKLYVSTTSGFRQTLNDPPTTYKLFQFDLTATDIPASKFKIKEKTGFRGALQLGPDGRIYATVPLAYSDPNGFATSLDVIENPLESAVNIIYTDNAINLNGRLSTQGLPPFISSLLLPINLTDSATGNTINNQTLQYCVGQNHIIIPDTVVAPNPPIYEWTFDNGTGGAPVVIANTVNLTLNTLVLTDAGTYKLKVTYTDTCGNVTTLEGTFIINVFEAATATQPTDYFFCDTDNDGFNSFDLQADKNAEILNGLDPTIFEVRYFLSQVGANTNDNANALANPYTNPTAFSNQTIYARVHNKNAPTACFETTSFTLAVTGLPIAQTPTTYNICDDTTVGTDTDGFINHFLLNTKDAEILGALDPTVYSVSYHTTLIGAQTDNATDVIDKTIDYTNIVAHSQPIFVRVENVNNAACSDTSKTFHLVVNPLSVITANIELKQCDNDVDGFSDFNLYEANQLISADYLNENFVYFPSLPDAQNNLNPIVNPTSFTNRVRPVDNVWARIYTINGCYRIAQVDLIVSVTGIPAGFHRDFSACDDFLDIDGNDNINNNDTDGISTFDFSNVTTDVENALGNPPNIIITYYRNEADALAEANVITDPSNYRNIGYPNTQPIYIRVDSTLDNACLGFGPYITLTVDANPTAAAVLDLQLCDDLDDGDGTNGIAQSFDLESQTATILGGQSPANFTVTYHANASDANTGLLPLASPYTNTTRDLQTIYVRVTNNNGGCFTDHTTFNLIVNPLPIANFVDDIEVCDDDSDGSARNGFSQIIDLEQNTATVLGAQDPAIFSVTYHRSLADAQAGLLPLGSPYSNLTPFRETIYIRVYDANTGCANGISQFDVIVNPEPVPNPQNTLSNLSYCDDDNSGLGSDTDGIYENIDLESQIPDILGPDNSLPFYQDPDDYTVTFHHNQADATSGDNPIASPYTNTASTETIFVRIENKTTGCINDDLTFDLIINPLPDFQITSPQIVCLNILPKNIAIENPNDVYDYEWKDENGVVVGTNTTLEVSVGGLYSVTATTTNGTNCSRTRSIQVNESIIATFVENDVTIVDDSANNTITINNVNGHLGIGDYEYALTDERGNFIRVYQDEPVFENLDGNVYNVWVRDKNDCGEVHLTVPVVEFPKFFTPNGDGINDVWEIKGVNATLFPISKVFIFDRLGKVVGEIKINGQGWNGRYNGKTLPSDDYWFSILLVDINGVKRERKGNFSLLRK